MFKNYLKLAWRNLFRHKSFSVINLLGLTSGITCTIFIFLWVQDELTFNKSHKNYDHIYQVFANRDFKNLVFTDPNMVFPLGFALNEGLPQIKASVVTTHSEPHILDYNETRVKKTGYSVSDKFFQLFSWKFTRGNPATALADPSSLVITESTAKAFFGNDNPINKTIRFDHQTALKVTGVIQDPPGNSTLQFDFIRPFNLSDPNLRNQMGQWRNSSWNVFVLMNPGANIAQLDKDINGVMKKHDPEERFSTYFSFPMNKWRLYSEFRDGKNVGGMIQYVRLFTIIAVIILLIACVNFMNLSTARSEKRAREVGIRKTLGSDRKRLIFQFFMESTLLTLMAFVFSLLIVFIMMPAFNLLVGKQLSFDLSQPVFWKWATLIVLITGLVAGSYPALYLSSFNPLKVLSGTFLSGRRAILPRRILVIGQFIISILLISATVIVYQQMQYIRNRDMGYNPNNLIMIPSTQNTDQKFSAFKQGLFQTGIVTAVTRTSSPMTQIWWKFPCPDYAGKPADATAIFSGLAADADFTRTMGIRILEGRDFSGTPADSSSVLLNKAAVDAMGIKNPIGMQIRFGRGVTVIGVTENVIMGSPYAPVDPMMVVYNGNNSGFMSIRLKDGILPQTALARIRSVYEKFDADFPFEYQFADEEFDKKIATEALISKLTNVFAGLAIFICCIGLGGLASFTIEKRIREIGIRKVLGATLRQLLMLLSKEFLRLAAIALLIAIPLTWWLMNIWLDNYVYRIQINVLLFGFVGLGMLALTVVIVSLSTTKAAMTNPVKNLRRE